MQECKNPSVGIWWFYYVNVLFADPVEVEKGLPYGDCIAGLSAMPIIGTNWIRLEN